jgi:NADPH-dependent 2,4-dienoyl-CoA reductase/sulfur reductase-like enzyme
MALPFCSVEWCGRGEADVVALDGGGATNSSFSGARRLWPREGEDRVDDDGLKAVLPLEEPGDGGGDATLSSSSWRTVKVGLG